jgi:TRAP-type mannitol/chloroaromatic compound transport system permease small subunit
MEADGQNPSDGVRSPISDWLESGIDWIGKGTAWVCMFIVLLVAFNVILRYAFRMGPVALQELEWHLMSPIALLGMSYALRHGDHVRVDILYERFGRTLQQWIDLIAALVTVVVAVIIFKLSLGFVEQAYSIGEGSPDPGGLPHRFVLRAFIPLGFALLAVQALAQALRHGLALTGRR